MHGKTNRLFVAGLVFFALLGFVLRLAYLASPVTYDEAYNYLAYARGSLLTAIAKYNLPNNHILNSILMRTIRATGGDSIWALRLPVFLFGSLIPITTGAVSWKLLASSERAERNFVTITAVALAGISLPLIHYSVEARGYAAQATFFLLSLLAADRILNRPCRRAQLSFAIFTALGLLAVATHLFAVASLAVWMIACALIADRPRDRARLKRVIQTLGLSGLAAIIAYAPAIIYVALFGTKIEPSEPLGALPSSIALRFFELIANWQSDLGVVALAWLGAGIIAALFFAGWRNRLPWLLVSLVIGPLCVFIAMKRPAPYPRIWVFTLPILFSLAGLGWWRLIARFSRSDRARTAAYSILAIVAIASCLQAPLKFLAADPIPPNSAEFAWAKVIRDLKPGDHLAFESLFYDRIRLLAVTRHEQSFEPLDRMTDGRLAVVQDHGFEIKKANPFDLSKPGRVLLFAQNEADIKAMEDWLAPYAPVGASIDHRFLSLLGSGDRFPRLYEFSLSRH